MSRRRDSPSSRPKALGANFTKLLAGRGTSAFGNTMSIVSLPLMVIAIGGNSSEVGLVLLTGMAPRVIFPLVGGVLADWRSPKSVMIVSDLVSGTAQATMGIVYVLGYAKLWMVLCLTLVHSVGVSMFMPASSSILPRLVRKEQLHAANTRLTIALSIGGIVGSGVAGVFVAVIGVGWVFLIDALTFAASASAVATIRPRLSEPAHAGPAKTAPQFVSLLREGVHGSARYPWFWRSLSLHLCLNACVAVWFACAPIAVVRYFGGSIAWSAVATAATAGGLLGGLVASRLTISRPLRMGVLLFGMTGIQLVALGEKAPLPLIMVIVGLCVAGSAIGSIAWATTLQHAFAEGLLARVNAVDFSVSMAGAMLGYLLAGPMTYLLGLPEALVTLGVILLAMTGVVWLALGRSADESLAASRQVVTEGA